jgi:ABC-type branched-subunit amino acid transport system substrate-binding protein
VSPELAQALDRLEKADHLFLAIYQNHLKEFPSGPLADTALMKTGTVHIAMGDYREARKVFHRLIRQHPKSPFVEDARFNVILAYHKEGNYRAAVNYASSVLRSAKTYSHMSRIHNLMGYSYSANRQFEEGLKSYMNAYRLAKSQERAEILSKVKEVIAYLEEPELNSMLDVYTDGILGGYLRLQLARVYALEDRIEQALKVLSDFTIRFPHHDEFETATALMEELKSGPLVDPFSIGCILPLTGSYGTFGNRALMGIELALDQFNTRTDANPIQLLIRDSKGDPNEAARAVEDLAFGDRVIGIIGPMITSESAAVRAQALKVPIMTLTQKPDITKLGDCVFRNFLTLSLQAKAIAAYAVQELGIKRFAILYPEERYGISFMNTFWDELIVHDAKIVGIESYGTDQTDFADAVNKLVGMYYPRPEEPEEEEGLDDLSAEARAEYSLKDVPGDAAPKPGMIKSLSPLDTTTPLADEPTEEEEKEPKPIIDFGAVFIPDTFEKAGLIAPQFPYYDVGDVLLLGTNLWHSDKLIQMARRYVQGAIVPDGFFLESPSPAVQDFVMRFEKIFGSSPGFLEAQAFDAASIIFQLTNHPDVRSRRTMKEALMEVKDFPGMTGLTSFDETGDVDKQIYLLKIKGRRFVQIRP